MDKEKAQKYLERAFWEYLKGLEGERVMLTMPETIKNLDKEIAEAKEAQTLINGLL